MDCKRKALYNYRNKIREENGERFEEYLRKQREYAKRHYERIRNDDDEKYLKHKENMKIAYYRKMSEEQLKYTLEKLKVKNIEKYNFILENI